MNIIANHKSSKFIINLDPNQFSKLYRADLSTPLITRLLDKMNTLSKNTWIPSHIGIRGKERVDKAAKKALQTHISNTKIPYTNLKPLINEFILKKWQKSWDDQTQKKLHHIQDTIGEWPAGYRRNDNLQTPYWSHPDYPFTPPKRGTPPSMFNMQSTSHSQTFS